METWGTTSSIFSQICLFLLMAVEAYSVKHNSGLGGPDLYRGKIYSMTLEKRKK